MMCNLHTPRRRVLLLCGGRSDEHEVSLESARSVLDAVSGRGDLALEVTPLVITRAGELLEPAASRALLAGAGEVTAPQELRSAGAASQELQSAAVAAPELRSAAAAVPKGAAAGPALRDHVGANGSPSGETSAALAALGPALGVSAQQHDVVFPLLHGPFGEDGRLQGLFDVLGLRYVGAGVMSSAVGMDKLTMKAVFAGRGLPQVAYRAVTRSRWRANPESVMAEAEELGHPLFVKPANLGSSIGISRVDTPQELVPALETALAYDRRVVVERAAIGARELEVAVLGNDEPEFSPVGEIRHGGEFYDYETKYQDGRARLVIPAPLDDAVAARCLALARAAYEAIDGAGLARVDMFLLPDGGLLLNEINTMPGFTRHSMYPKLWEAGGLAYPQLIRRLVDLAFDTR